MLWRKTIVCAIRALLIHRKHGPNISLRKSPPSSPSAKPPPLRGRLKVSLHSKTGARSGAPTGDYLRRDSIGHCAGHKVSFWSVAIESRHSSLQNDTLMGVRRNITDAHGAPLRGAVHVILYRRGGYHPPALMGNSLRHSPATPSYHKYYPQATK